MNKKILINLRLGFLLLLVATAAKAQSSAYFQAVTNLNPVAYWPLQETAPPPAADTEPNLGSLGAVANAYYSSTNVYRGQTGSPADSADAYVQCNSTNGSFLAVPLTDPRVSLPSGPFAVEAWVNPANTTASTIIAQTGVAGSGGLNGTPNSAGWSLNLGYVPSLALAVPGTVAFHVYNGVGSTGGAEATFTPSGFTLNNWYHVVAVFDGANASLYVNGALVAGSGVAGSWVTPMTGTQARDTWDPLTIGCGGGLNNNRFNGSLDEVAIYTNALTATQVANHYNASFSSTYFATIQADKPYMYWRMDAPAYTTPDVSAYPVAANYGSAVGGNGLCLLGTTPGITGPDYTGMGSPSLGCAISGLGSDNANTITVYKNGTGISSVNVLASGILLTNMDAPLLQSNKPETLMCWFKANPADPTRFQNLVGLHSDAGARLAFQSGLPQWYSGAGGNVTPPASATYNDGNWHFIAGVYTNAGAVATGTNFIYVDGVLLGSAVNTNAQNPTLTNSAILLGGDSGRVASGNGNAYSERFGAVSLAHVAYFTNALTASQIANLYVAAGGAPTPVITGNPVTGRTNSPGTGDNGSGPGSYIFMGVTFRGATDAQWYFSPTATYSGATLLSNGNKYALATQSGLAAVTSQQMTISNLVDSDSGYYFVVLSNSSYGSVTSSLASFKVITEPYITSQTPAGGSLQLYQNQNFTLSVTAGGQTNLVYSWLTNGTPDTTAGNNSSYPLTSVQTTMSGTYQCIITNNSGAVTSSVVTLTVLTLPAAVTNSTYSSNLLALSPSGYWPMHEVAAAAPGDVETNLGTLGDLANGYYADWNGPTAYIVHGVPGTLTNDDDSAVLFNNAPNGTNPGYLIVPRTSPATTLRAPFTLEAWVKPINAGFGDIICQGPWNVNANGSTSGSRYGIRMCWGAGGTQTTVYSDFQIYVGPGTGTGNPSTPTPTQVLPIGQWYHIALVTADNTNWTFYVNGNVHFSFVLPMGIDTGDPLLVGQGLWQSGGPQRGFPGAIDEVAIYTNALQQSDIQTHYNDGISGSAGQYKSDVLALNPIVYLRMDAPAYTPPPVNTWPVLANYGTVGGNGVYSPGSLPGAVAGPAAVGIPGQNVMPGNGMSSYADAGNDAAFNPKGATAFSYSAWFRGNPADSRSFQTIMGRSDTSFRAAINSAGKLQAHAGATDITSPTIYNDGNWHQFIITYTGTNTTYNSTNTGTLGINTLYVDGVQIGQSTGAANPGTNLDVLIGDDPGNLNNPVGTGRDVAGQICEAAFWNGVTLNSNQVLTLFNSSAIVPTITTQPVSASVNARSSFTNKVAAFGGNPLSYQWYRDGQPLPIGGQTNLTLGATNASLAINPVAASDESADYYVVISNSGGSVTSSVVSLTVFSQPAFTSEPIDVTRTNNILLFSGAAPTFEVATIGAQPVYYQWFTNGAPATTNGVTLTSYTLPPEQLSGGVTNFFCVASNFVGRITNAAISVTVLDAPASPYPQAVLAANPIGYWRLNEPDDQLSDGNPGAIADDYWGGNNGIYTNTSLGQPGYTANQVYNSDQAETSAGFDFVSSKDGDAYGISGVDFGSPANTSVGFSVETWVNGYPQNHDSGIVSKGFGGGGEQFDLDTGGNPAGTDIHSFRFLVRDAAGNVHAANSAIVPSYGTWHHVVGVCDEVNGNVTLYVDGVMATNAVIPPGSGILTSSRAMIIGSRPSNGTTNVNDLQFSGDIDDVSVYNYALSANQVGTHYTSAGAPPIFIQAPPANVTVNGFGQLTLPVAAVGTPIIVYRWQDVNGGTNLAFGFTNGPLLDATLTVPNVPLTWNGDTLELTVTNVYGPTNIFVTLTVYTNAPQITADLPPLVLEASGKSYVYSVGVGGPQPYGYQWYNGAALLAGETNSTYSLVAGSPGSTTYHVVITNIFGASTSSISTFTSIALPSGYSYAANVLGLNPAGYWPLQETNPPAVATIETNYGRLGALGNAYYVGTNAGSAVAFAQSGALGGDSDTAVGFNSYSPANGQGYMVVPSVSRVLALNPPFSLECWANPPGNDTFGDLVGDRGTALDNATAGVLAGTCIQWEHSPFQFSFYAGNGTGQTEVRETDVITPGGWHHVVLTCDANTNFTLYVDGVNEVSRYLPYVPSLWNPLTIGAGFWDWTKAFSPYRGYSGGEDEVALYTNVLSASRVLAHYNAGNDPTDYGAYNTNVLADQPLLYYRMDCAGYTNTPAALCPTAANFGSASVNGIYLPGIVPGGVSGPPNAVLGANSVSAPINGTFSCVDAGYDPAFNPTGTQPFTAMTWFRTYPSDSRVQTIMSHGVNNWAMNLDGTTGRIVWNLYNGGQVTSTTVLNDGNWHFVAGVYDGANSYLYVDGALNSSGVVAGGLIGETNADLFLGGNPDYTAVGTVNQRYFAGALAQAAIFTSALTSAQIQMLYTGGVAPMIGIARAGNNMIITYTGSLMSSTNVAGPYGTVTGASSPYTTPATNAQMFYRAHQ